MCAVPRGGHLAPEPVVARYNEPRRPDGGVSFDPYFHVGESVGTAGTSYCDTKRFCVDGSGVLWLSSIDDGALEELVAYVCHCGV